MYTWRTLLEMHAMVSLLDLELKWLELEFSSIYINPWIEQIFSKVLKSIACEMSLLQFVWMSDYLRWDVLIAGVRFTHYRGLQVSMGKTHRHFCSWPISKMLLKWQRLKVKVKPLILCHEEQVLTRTVGLMKHFQMEQCEPFWGWKKIPRGKPSGIDWEG